MGDAKRRAKKLVAFLDQHPLCVYCGESADTIDHCPPRCFFLRRHWPETFEFPACNSCNSSASHDEMALAVIARSRLTGQISNLDQEEFHKLVRGVRNNCPEIFAEWLQVSPVEKKRYFRKTFGALGDVMRYQKYGIVNMGNLTQMALQRFMVKLAKALFYKHNERIFDGVIYVNHVSVIDMDQPELYFEQALHFAPLMAITKRNGALLTEQFSYRFFYNSEHSILYAVVRFTDQFVAQLIAVGWEMEQQLADESVDTRAWPMNMGRHECSLNHRKEVS